jgi:archaellum component FlaF (FlaF/FlaG flagellin family)
MVYVVSALLLISLYVNWNLFRKNENLEDANEEAIDWVISTKNNLISILNKIREIDNKKMFESDDEVGTTFKMIKDQINNLEESFENRKQ